MDPNDYKHADYEDLPAVPWWLTVVFVTLAVGAVALVAFAEFAR